MNNCTQLGEENLLPNPNILGRDAVGQDGSVSAHQEDGELGEDPSYCLPLLLTSMPRLGRGQLLHLLHSHFVPATQGLGLVLVLGVRRM